jgi:tetratricopeptide (TPR) repeat protein
MSLASSYVSQWDWQLSQDPQTLEQALTMAQKAIALNNSLPLAHTVLGYVYLWQKQYDEALAELERTIALDHNEALNSGVLAMVLSDMGRTADALQAAAQALRLKPFVADGHLVGVGAAYAVAGHYEEALEPLQRYLHRYPNILPAHLMLAAVYGELGQAAEAQKEAAEVLQLNPNFSLEVYKQRMPIKDPAVLERHIAALRKAGLK